MKTYLTTAGKEALAELFPSILETLEEGNRLPLQAMTEVDPAIIEAVIRKYMTDNVSESWSPAELTKGEAFEVWACRDNCAEIALVFAYNEGFTKRFLIGGFDALVMPYDNCERLIAELTPEGDYVYQAITRFPVEQAASAYLKGVLHPCSEVDMLARTVGAIYAQLKGFGDDRQNNYLFKALTASEFKNACELVYSEEDDGEPGSRSFEGFCEDTLKVFSVRPVVKQTLINFLFQVWSAEMSEQPVTTVDYESEGDELARLSTAVESAFEDNTSKRKADLIAEALAALSEPVTDTEKTEAAIAFLSSFPDFFDDVQGAVEMMNLYLWK